MTVDNVTSNRGYALPNPANNLDDDVLRLIAAFNAIDTDVAAVVAGLITKAALVHGHLIADVSGLQAALDGKMAVGSVIAFASLGGVSVGGSTNGMFLRFDGTSWSPVTFDGAMVASGTISAARLPSYLASSALSSNYAAIVHGHAIADVTGLQTVLDGKAALSHTHTLSQITDAGTAASKNVGTAVGNVVQVQTDGKLPALDGSMLTNLPIPATAQYTRYDSGSGNWPVPSVGDYVLVRLWGAGGSGSGSGNVSSGGGGGAFKERFCRISELGAAGTLIPWSVAAGGASVTSGNGNPGGNSSFGSGSNQVIAYGGGGGSGGTSAAPGTGGGWLAAGGTNVGSGSGGSGATGGGDAGTQWAGANGGGNGTTPGGNALYGGAGGGGAQNSPSQSVGGVSIFGGNGGNGANGVAGAGAQPGGGGGASRGGTSGKGGDGRIEIYIW